MFLHVLPRPRVWERVRLRTRTRGRVSDGSGQACSFLGNCGLLRLKRPHFTISALFKSHTKSVCCVVWVGKDASWGRGRGVGNFHVLSCDHNTYMKNHIQSVTTLWVSTWNHSYLLNTPMSRVGRPAGTPHWYGEICHFQGLLFVCALSPSRFVMFTCILMYSILKIQTITLPRTYGL